MQWLSQSIAEIRSELAELQGSFGGGSKDAQFRNQLLEDLSTLRADFGTAKLELESLRSRQEKTEVLVRELQEEAVQSADDIRRSLNMRHEKVSERTNLFLKRSTRFFLPSQTSRLIVAWGPLRQIRPTGTAGEQFFYRETIFHLKRSNANAQ